MSLRDKGCSRQGWAGWPQRCCVSELHFLCFPDTKPRSGPGRIVIKNLKYSSVYEETVRQVEEQAKLKAERYEEGELSEDSSDNKEASPTDDDLLALSPGIPFLPSHSVLYKCIEECS